MRKRQIAVLATSGLLLTGCLLPVQVSIAAYVMDGVLFAASGKSLSDHALSAAVQQDCAVFRIVTDGEICRTNPDGDIGNTLPGEPAPAVAFAAEAPPPGGRQPVGNIQPPVRLAQASYVPKGSGEVSHRLVTTPPATSAIAAAPAGPRIKPVFAGEVTVDDGFDRPARPAPQQREAALAPQPAGKAQSAIEATSIPADRGPDWSRLVYLEPDGLAAGPAAVSLPPVRNSFLPVPAERPQRLAATDTDGMTLREVQEHLRRRGFDTGPVDGILGPRTRRALADYAEAHGLSGGEDPAMAALSQIRGQRLLASLD